jgi:hypothetical protein
MFKIVMANVTTGTIGEEKRNMKIALNNSFPTERYDQKF